MQRSILQLRQNTLDAGTLDELAGTWVDGRLKQYVLARTLAAKKNRPEVFSEGDYVPLDVVGPMAKHLVAFARVSGASSTITVVSRLVGRLLSENNGLAVLPSRWSDTVIKIPDAIQGSFSDAFVPDRRLSIGAEVRPGELFAALPIAFVMRLRP